MEPLFYSDQSFTFSFDVDPYYYHSAAQNNFVFHCEYIAPIGNVNFVFPDEQCASLPDFDFYIGQSVSIDELVVDEIWLGANGSVLDFDLSVYKLIPSSMGYNGESFSFSLLTQYILSVNFGYGQSVSFDFVIPVSHQLSLVSYCGEACETSLAMTQSLDIEFRCGETAKFNDVYYPVSSNFSSFHGSNAYTNSGVCLTLNSLQSSIPSAGINAISVIPDGVLESNKETLIGFYRTRAPSWYDDDFSDASLQLILLPGRNVSDIIYSSNTWGYDSVIHSSIPQSLVIYLRFSSSAALTASWNSGSALYSITFTVVSQFTSGELSGTEKIQIKIVTGNSSTQFTVYGASGDIRQTAVSSQMINIWDNQRPAPDLFVVHYHNYLTNSPETLCDISLSSPGIVSTDTNPITLSPAYCGETFDFDLSREILFRVNQYCGVYSTVSLDTVPAFNFGLQFYDGERLDLTLVTYSSVEPVARCGESSSVTLSTFESSALALSFYCGETYQNRVSFIPGLISDGRDGDTFFFDFAVTVNPGMNFDSCYSGVTAFLDSLSTSYNIGHGYFVGESSDFSLATTYALYPSGYNGERLSVTLTSVLPITFTLNAQCGELSQVQFSTSMIFPIRSYNGELFSIDFVQSLAPGIEVTSFSGFNVQLSLQTSTSLPIGRFYCGQSAMVEKIDTEPNWHFSSGCSGEISLATEYSFDLSFISRETGNCGLSVKPGEPLQLSYYTGQSFESVFNVLYHADLYVTFENSLWVQCDIDSTTNFDLSSDLCCGFRVKQATLNFEMARAPYPEETYSGTKLEFSLELSCRPRLSFDFFTGNGFVVEDRSTYFEFDFFTGVESGFFWEANLVHRLCKGAFIPNGNWLVVELTDALDELCSVDRFYYGSMFKCDLSVDLYLRPESNYCGEKLSVELDTNPPWAFNFHVGPGMSLNFPLEAKPEFRTGEFMAFSFYEPPIYAHTGCSFGLDELVTTYGVRFKEEGCLENQFVYQDKDGDKIDELFNPIPVEGEPYKHDILGECF